MPKKFEKRRFVFNFTPLLKSWGWCFFSCSLLGSDNSYTTPLKIPLLNWKPLWVWYMVSGLLVLMAHKSGKEKEHKDYLFGPGGCRVGWVSFTGRGGGRKVRALPRKVVFLEYRGREPGMSQECCRDVPGGAQKVCAKI